MEMDETSKQNSDPSEAHLAGESLVKQLIEMVKDDIGESKMSEDRKLKALETKVKCYQMLASVMETMKKFSVPDKEKDTDKTPATPMTPEQFAKHHK